MVLGGHRNDSATKAGISESQSVTVPGFFTVHVVKSRAGASMMQTKDYWWVRPCHQDSGKLSLGGVKGLKRTSSCRMGSKAVQDRQSDG